MTTGQELDEPEGDEDGPNEMDAILVPFFENEISVQAAADRIAALTLKDEVGKLDHTEWPTGSFSLTWQDLIYTAHQEPEHQDKLVDLLVTMAALPTARDKDGNAIIVSGMRLWADLPCFCWEFNPEWNALEVPESGPERQNVIDQFINVNRFVAKLLRTRHPVFKGMEWFVLLTMRHALEEVMVVHMRMKAGDGSDVWLPAASLLVSMIGSEMHRWEIEYAKGPSVGDPGRSGPLYAGRPGFNKERWQFWKKRFEELSVSGDLPNDLRQEAAKGLARMVEVEAQPESDGGAS